MSIEKIIADVQQQYRTREKAINNPVVHHTCHVFSNETNMATVFNKLSSQPSLKVARKNNMAIFIGESCFLSLLPVVAKHADSILFIDIDRRVLAHNLFMINSIKSARNRLEFVELLRNPQKNPLLQEKVTMEGLRRISLDGSHNHNVPDVLVLDPILITVMLQGSKTLLGGKHFLDTNEQFDIVKQHVTQIRFHVLELDFYQNDLVAFLGEKLFIHDIHVPIINISNLYDYDNPPHALDPNHKKPWYSSGKLYQTIFSLLSRPEETLIMYSVMNSNTEYTSLTADVASGLTEYKKRTQDYSGFINAKNIAAQYGKIIPSLKCQSVFFNTNLGSATVYRFKELEEFLKTNFNGCEIDYTQVTSKYFLIDMVIRSNRETAERLLIILKKHAIPHSHSPLNNHVIIVLREVNSYGAILVKMTQSKIALLFEEAQNTQKGKFLPNDSSASCLKYSM